MLRIFVPPCGAQSPWPYITFFFPSASHISNGLSYGNLRETSEVITLPDAKAIFNRRSADTNKIIMLFNLPLFPGIIFYLLLLVLINIVGIVYHHGLLPYS